MRTNEFKSNLDSITYQDVLALRRQKEKHALKLEDLNMTLEKGDEIVEALKDFLLELGYSQDRIDLLDCRRRDGFIPNSFNKGGIEAICFRDQTSCGSSTGFENADATLEKCSQYNLESFAEDNGLDASKYGDWTDEQRDQWYEYESNDEDTVLFSVDLMLTSETELNIRMCVCAKDSPYHRQYDDLIEFDVEFKSVAGLRQKLKRILKNKTVRTFSQNVNEGF